MENILIKNGKIVDGTGTKGKVGNITVKDGKIKEIFASDETEAEKVIDAKDLIVSPGFIDIHTHADSAVLTNNTLPEKVTQGVTSVIVGQCGSSLAPISNEIRESTKHKMRATKGHFPSSFGWERLADYRAAVEKTGTSVNVGTFVGHGNLRNETVGVEPRKASPEEISKMCEMAEGAISEGAVGISTGLSYAPCSGSSTKELIELAKAIGGKGFFAIHKRRDEGKLGSIKECIQIAETSSTAVHMNHLLPRPDNAGKAQEMLDLVEKARARGLDITIGRYPYIPGAGALVGHLPESFQKGTDQQVLSRLKTPKERKELKSHLRQGNIPNWSSIVISYVHSDKNQSMVGKSIEELSGEYKKDPIDFVCDLLLQEKLEVAIIRTAGSSTTDAILEADLEKVLKYDNCIIASDSLHHPGKLHPRTYGTYPRYLGNFIREKGYNTMEEGLRKCTSLPAGRLGLTDRGVLKEGYQADIVIFDENEVIDGSSFENDGNVRSAGIEYVIVNGSVVFSDDNIDGGTLPGTWIE